MVKELHPRGLAPLSVFRTGALLLCQPSAKWSGWRELHSRPPGSRPGHLLLTYTLSKVALAEGLSPSSPVLEAPCSGTLSYASNGCRAWARTRTRCLTGTRATLTLHGSKMAANSRSQYKVG